MKIKAGICKPCLEHPEVIGTRCPKCVEKELLDRIEKNLKSCIEEIENMDFVTVRNKEEMLWTPKDCVMIDSWKKAMLNVIQKLRGENENKQEIEKEIIGSKEK